MEEIKKELNAEELEEVSGGSIFNRESSIRGAGIELWKEYGKVPGEFGYLWNSGDYCFKGQKIDLGDVNILEFYRDGTGEVAPSLKEAEKYFKKNHLHGGSHKK